MKIAIAAIIILALGASAVAGVVVFPLLTRTVDDSIEESLELTNQHVWYDQSGWAEAAIAVVNNGEKDAVLRKITARSTETKWNDIYFWKTDTGPVSDELKKTASELSGGSVAILVDGKQRTFQQATNEIALPCSWTTVLYIKNPGNITSADVGHQIAIAVFTETKLYSKEATIITTTQTGQAGAIISEANTRFYNVSATKYIGITLMNSGTADAKITAVYIGTSSVNLEDVTTSVTFNPTTKIVAANGGSIIATWSYDWVSGQRYYFKFTTEAGQVVPFDRVAP